MQPNNEARAVAEALRLLAGDASMPGRELDIVRDILELLPDLVALHQRGYGELKVKYAGAKIVEQDCTLHKVKRVG